MIRKIIFTFKEYTYLTNNNNTIHSSETVQKTNTISSASIKERSFSLSNKLIIIM